MSQNANIYILSSKVHRALKSSVAYAGHSHTPADCKKGVGVEGFLSRAQNTLSDQFLRLQIKIAGVQGYDLGNGRFAVANDYLFAGPDLTKVRAQVILEVRDLDGGHT